jgi:hypothetical protein
VTIALMWVKPGAPYKSRTTCPDKWETIEPGT